MTALNINNQLNPFTPSTSGSYTFSVTQAQVIRQMMLDIGALAEGDDPTAQEYSDASFKLNMLVKQWMGDTDFAPGMKVWTRKRADLFLGYSKFCYSLGQTGDNWVQSTTGLAYPVSYGTTNLAVAAAQGATVLTVNGASQFNVGDYIGIVCGSDIYWTTISAFTTMPTLTVTIPSPGLPFAAGVFAYVWNYTVKGVRPLKMISVVLRDINSNDTPMRLMTVERYESLPSKVAPSNVADPTAVLYETQFSNQYPNGRLYLDVAGAQDVTKHLHCVYLSPVQDLVNPGDSPDYPQQWYRPICWGLGKDCCGMFDCAWTSDMEQNFQDSLAIARQGDPAVTDVYFEAEGDGPYGRNS